MLATFYKKYEQRLSILAFLTGFTIDNFTLTRIDLWLDNAILGTYLFLAASGIFLFQFLIRKKIHRNFTKNVALLLPLLIQFAFGGLFSGYFVFYSRSASFTTSWLFVMLIILLLIGNEFFKRKYARLEFQVSILFITLFSFAIFYVPILLNDLGMHTFLLSGLVSLILIGLFVRLLGLAIPKKVKRAKPALTMSVLGIYLIFNILYFTNIIPPIPLSLKEAGVYHDVTRLADGYRVQEEKVEWYELERKIRNRIHVVKGDSVYVFSSVFAPTDLNITIFHRWQYLDEVADEWVEVDRFPYGIVGGRDGGYRGFSRKAGVFSGKWRVDVITGREQVIGRQNFEILMVNVRPEVFVKEL